MESISTDSMLFYLQQIKEPHKLVGVAQANYCYLLYKATLWGTGKSKDSLLQASIPAFREAKENAKWMKARVEQANGFLYTKQPDMALYHANRIHKDERTVNDTLKLRLYGIARAAYMQKELYPQALQMADSSLMLAHQMNDTLLLIRTTQTRLKIIEKMNRNDDFVKETEALMHKLDSSIKYRSMNYYLAESLTAFYLCNKEFTKALTYSNLIRHYQRSRYDVPYWQLMRGRIHQTLNNIDSAKVYYTLASNSLSNYVAAEATISLFQLINAEEYPEQAFYTAQKEKELHQHVEMELNSRMEERKYNETKLQNELYQLRLSQQENELWMMGTVILLLIISMIASLFYQREKKKRLLSEQNRHKAQIEEEAKQLQHENVLLYKEAELSALREKGACLRNKEHELREAIFRRISFFHKLSPLSTDSIAHTSNRRIEVTDAEWKEVRLAVNDGFDNFALRLQREYPLLTEKEIYFCCLVKVNTNMQDLSDIYCVSKAAITKRKYRIKTDKLGITDENSCLDQILQQF